MGSQETCCLQERCGCRLAQEQMGWAPQKLSLESESQPEMRGTGRSEARPITDQAQVLGKRGTFSGPREEMEAKVQEDPPGRRSTSEPKGGSQRGSWPKAKAICSLFYVCVISRSLTGASKYCYQRSNPFPTHREDSGGVGAAAQFKVAGVGGQNPSSRKKGSEVNWLLNPLKLD